MTTALKRKRNTALEGSPEARVAATDWACVAADLDASGVAPLEGLLTADECAGSPPSTTTSGASAAAS